MENFNQTSRQTKKGTKRDFFLFRISKISNFHKKKSLHRLVETKKDYHHSFIELIAPINLILIC